MAESDHCTIKELVFNRDQDPDHTAIECPGLHPLTYRDLRMQILSVVKALNARGLHRNDRIAVITPAGPETAVIIISVMAGFTCVPLNPQSREQEYERNFSQLKIKAIIVQRGYATAATTVATCRGMAVIELLPLAGMAGRFTLEPAGVQDTTEAQFATPSDISHIFLTSGTTTRPKIVPLSQKQTFSGRQRQAVALKMTRTDRCLNISPYFHGMGLHTALLSVLYAGGTVICIKEFIPPDFFFLLKTLRPTFYVAGPAHHQGILREMKKIPPREGKQNSLRLIVSSSASLPARVSRELETALGVAVTEQYGLSETGVISINIPFRTGSVGIPVIEHLKILDEDGTVLGNGCEGEIVVKGDTVFSGYEDAPDENKAAFTDGWFRTGDTGYLDRDGYLFLTGRKKEMINKGGEKISPEEIDTVLRSHMGVRDAMTFGIADPVLGEDVAALVVPADDHLTETDLRIFLLDRLVQFKVPRRIWFVEAVPRNAAGKPLRRAGTERYS
jgi:acyl-CoA synthetase (AMP-forming)/AMP-acid ligase II